MLSLLTTSSAGSCIQSGFTEYIISSSILIIFEAAVFFFFAKFTAAFLDMVEIHALADTSSVITSRVFQIITKTS